jgi:23S rRNA (guanosine2251-2'-O)-methyltransferase
VLYGWHTVTAALANPRRRIRKLLLTENAALRLTHENINTRITPEIVRPSAIDQRLGPDAVHQGLLAEADPLPSPDIETLTQEGIVLVLDQITDPHNVGAIMRSAAAFAVKAIVTTARHSPEATGVLAKSASGALEVVPLMLVQNLARALTGLNNRGFMTVGLDSDGGNHWLWYSVPKAKVCGSSRGIHAARSRASTCLATSRALTSRMPRCWRFISAPAVSASCTDGTKTPARTGHCGNAFVFQARRSVLMIPR